VPPALIVCPSCACHAKSVETTCPSCGEPLRRTDGSLPRAAVAVLLGLSAAAVGTGACSGGVAVHYGIAQTGPGGAGGVQSSSFSEAAAYGIAQTTGPGTGGAGGAGGAPSTSSGSGGAGGGDGGG
jgi:hypothetical protein